MRYDVFVRSFICAVLTGVLLCHSAPAETSDKPIKIGATVSLIGKYTGPSEMIKNAYKLWTKQVNGEGGLLGRPVQLILYDDESSEELCTRLYEKLITQDKVEILLAPYGSTLTQLAAEAAEKHGYFLLASAASADKIWKQGFKNVFGVYGPASRYFIGFLDLMARQGLSNVSIIYEKNSFNIAAAQGASQWAQRFGLNVVFFEEVASSEGFPEIIRQIKGLKTDALVFCAYPPNIYGFMKDLEKERYRPRALGFTIAPALPDFYEKVGPAAEGVFGPSQWEADERLPFPGTLDFISDFKKFANKPPSYHAGAAYAACQLVRKAVTQTQSMDSNKIGNYIRGLDTVTIIGRFKVDSDGLQVGHNPFLIQWQNGKKEIVYPTNMRTSEPRFK